MKLHYSSVVSQGKKVCFNAALVHTLALTTEVPPLLLHGFGRYGVFTQPYQNRYKRSILVWGIELK
jgi:hypothetical protein